MGSSAAACCHTGTAPPLPQTRRKLLQACKLPSQEAPGTRRVLAGASPLPTMLIMQPKAVRLSAALNQNLRDQEAAKSEGLTSMPAGETRGRRVVGRGSERGHAADGARALPLQGWCVAGRAAGTQASTNRSDRVATAAGCLVAGHAAGGYPQPSMRVSRGSGGRARSPDLVYIRRRPRLARCCGPAVADDSTALSGAAPPPQLAKALLGGASATAAAATSSPATSASRPSAPAASSPAKRTRGDLPGTAAGAKLRRSSSSPAAAA